MSATRYFLLLGALLLASCDARQHATTPSQRDLFEMKERCAESVPRVLRYSIDFGEANRALRTHYNSKLNRCYVLIKWQLSTPDLPTSFHWVIADAQSLAHVDVQPGDAVWKAAMEDEDLDAIVPGIAQSPTGTLATK